MACGQDTELIGNSIVRFPFFLQRCEVGIPLEGMAELFFIPDERIHLSRRHAGSGSELRGVPEDTELAGTPAKAHEVTRMRTNTVFLQDIPDIAFLPVPYGTEPVYETRNTSVAKVSLVRLEDSVFGSLRAFLSSFSGEDESTDALEPFLMTDCRGTDVDFEVSAAPADTEVRRRLWIFQSR